MDIEKFRLNLFGIMVLILFLSFVSIIYYILNENINTSPLIGLIWFLMGILAFPIVKDFYEASAFQKGQHGFIDIFNNSISDYLFFISVCIFMTVLSILFLNPLFSVFALNEILLSIGLLAIVILSVFLNCRKIFIYSLYLSLLVFIVAIYLIIGNLAFLIQEINTSKQIIDNFLILLDISYFFIFLTVMLFGPTIFIKYMKDNEETIELISSFSKVLMILIAPIILSISLFINLNGGKNVFISDNLSIILMNSFLFFGLIAIFICNFIFKILQSKNLFFKVKKLIYNKLIIFLSVISFLILVYLILIEFANSVVVIAGFSSVLLILISLVVMLSYRRNNQELFNIYTFKYVNFYYMFLIFWIIIYLIYLFINYLEKLIYFGVFIVVLSIIFIAIKYMNDEFFRIKTDNFIFFPLSYFFALRMKNTLEIKNSDKIMLIGFPLIFFYGIILNQCSKDKKIYVVCYTKVEKFLFRKIHLGKKNTGNLRVVFLKDNIVDFRLPKVDTVVCINMLSRLKSKSFFVSYINSSLEINGNINIIETMLLPYHRIWTVKQNIREAGFKTEFSFKKGLLFNHLVGKGHKITSVYYTKTWTNMQKH